MDLILSPETSNVNVATELLTSSSVSFRNHSHGRDDDDDVIKEPVGRFRSGWEGLWSGEKVFVPIVFGQKQYKEKSAWEDLRRKWITWENAGVIDPFDWQSDCCWISHQFRNHHWQASSLCTLHICAFVIRLFIQLVNTVQPLSSGQVQLWYLPVVRYCSRHKITEPSQNSSAFKVNTWTNRAQGLDTGSLGTD